MSTKKQSGLILAAIFLVAATASAGTYSGGAGDPNDPYQIATTQDLLDLGADTNDYNKCFIMTADINLQGQSFTTAIISVNGSPVFTGKFNGNNHTIAHFTINGSNDYLGLFGRINAGGEIKNLGLTDCNIGGTQGTDYAGSLAGMNQGIISNCYSTASVSGFTRLGGLVGYNSSGGNISDCCSTATIRGAAFMGGLVGYNDSGVITYCNASSDVNGTQQSIGGLAGYNAAVTGIASIRYCHSTGTVAGMQNVGGLVGTNYSNGNISHCYSASAVTGGPSSYAVGGLVGDSEYGSWNGYCITYCYSMGPVTGYSYVGGLVGQNRYGGDSNCYSTSSVSGFYNSQYVAGLVANITNGGSVSGSFWDKQASGQATSTGGAGKTTAEMKMLSTFTSAGWDFVQTWNIEENQTYPFFRISPAADLNHDGVVDFHDFAVFASQWLQ